MRREEPIERLKRPRGLDPKSVVDDFRLPASLITYQRDEIDPWPLTSTAVDGALVRTSLFASQVQTTAESKDFWRRTFNLLREMTKTEDIPLLAKVHVALDEARDPVTTT